MAGFICKQPNGLYCRFSTIVDCPTHVNMTAEDYMEIRAEEARKDAKNILERHLRPFEWVEQYFHPNNMTQEEFDQFLIDASTPVEKLPTTNPENNPSADNLTQKLSNYILDLKTARDFVMTGRDGISYGKAEVLNNVIERLEEILNG